MKIPIVKHKRNDSEGLTMKVIKLKSNHTFSGIKSYFVDYWPKGSTADDSVPIFHIGSYHDFNEIVGYAKFINGSLGTVLYRGQTEDYGSLVPSGARAGKVPVSPSLTADICADADMVKAFQLNDRSIDGWKEYQQVITEAIIQHYGGNTYCIDFVDNHWCALWFGANKFQKDHYQIRTDDSENLYVYLYLADTNTTAIRGMHIGEKSYVVDLRKAIPSFFQRPASQHGWVVRKRNILNGKCNYDDGVIGVIEVNLSDAKRWLGNGELLSQENFFPSYEIDQGYRVLLERQHRSGLGSTYKKLLPVKTIRNYHLEKTFYCSDRNKKIKPIKSFFINGKKVHSLSELYAALLTYGWKENSRSITKNVNEWNEDIPWEYQSAPTALLVQRYFGGDICSRVCLNRTHYFNKIDSVIIDLTFLEISQMAKNSPYDSNKVENLGHPKQTMINNAVSLNHLLHNCGIPDKVHVPSTRKNKRSVVRKKVSSNGKS